MTVQLTKQKGFTIVELLIVIVVIGILAAITIVAYNGVQARARQAKINSDLSMLQKAVQSARTLKDTTMYGVTGSGNTAASCVGMVDGSDLSNKTNASACWVSYTSALNKITTASGVDVNNLVDPWGRPYFIDENEGPSSCVKDDIGTFAQPFVSGWGSQNRLIQIPNSRTDC